MYKIIFSNNYYLESVKSVKSIDNNGYLWKTELGGWKRKVEGDLLFVTYSFVDLNL